MVSYNSLSEDYLMSMKMSLEMLTCYKKMRDVGYLTIKEFNIIRDYTEDVDAGMDACELIADILNGSVEYRRYCPRGEEDEYGFDEINNIPDEDIEIYNNVVTEIRISSPLLIKPFKKYKNELEYLLSEAPCRDFEDGESMTDCFISKNNQDIVIFTSDYSFINATTIERFIRIRHLIDEINKEEDISELVRK